MRRWRKTVLWVGCTLCVLIAVAFVASARWQISLQFPSSRGPALMVKAGSVMLANDELFSVTAATDSHSYGLSFWNSWWYRQVQTLAGPTSWTPPMVTVVEFPLWLPFLIVLLPTLAVWRFVPKFPPGHCPCGYDLHGNVSGICSECGRETEPTAGSTR